MTPRARSDVVRLPRAVGALLLAWLAVAACAPQSANAPPSAAPRALLRDDTAQGKILEVIEAKPYTFFRLATSAGERWFAAPSFAARVGEDVFVRQVVVQKNFRSRSMNRVFDVLYFGKVGPEQAPAAAAAGAAAPSAETAAPAAVAPATGTDAHTVAQVWAQRQALNGKAAVVRGKVVKVLAGTLNATWYHLQDGTGSPATGDDDLVVVAPETAQKAAVDAVVTFRGTVAADKDYGSGYAYRVILLDAQVVP